MTLLINLCITEAGQPDTTHSWQDSGGGLVTTAAAAAAKSLQSCPTLCDPIDGSPPGPPMHESEKWKWSRSVVSDS